MYIWQHHTAIPVVEKVKVYIDWREDETLRILLAWTQTRSAENAHPIKFLEASRTIFDAQGAVLENPDTMALHVLLTVVAVLRADNYNFRDECFRRLAYMVCLSKYHHPAQKVLPS
jgi:hypothetical protein